MADEKEKKEVKITDGLGNDYTYLLNRKQNTLVVSEEEIASEDTELLSAFMDANKDVQPYIDKAVFDPCGAVAKHIINLCKDKNYKVKVGEKEYRLPNAIMITAMSHCYNYVVKIAEQLANASGNRQCIQMTDEDVYMIAENFFKFGDKTPEIKVSTPSAPKKASKSSKPIAKTTPVHSDNDEDEPVEITDEPAKDVQISLFDMM